MSLRLQRQVPMGWNIEMSNLLLVGVAGSGTTTTIQSVVLGLAQRLFAGGHRYCSGGYGR